MSIDRRPALVRRACSRLVPGPAGVFTPDPCWAVAPRSTAGVRRSAKASGGGMPGRGCGRDLAGRYSSGSWPPDSSATRGIWWAETVGRQRGGLRRHHHCSRGGSRSVGGALVAAVLLRREDAFAGLYRRHVVLVSSMILGSGPDGDDVVAEVFAALRLVPEAFDPAARSESVDEVRRASSDPGPWSKWWAGGAADRGGLPPADVTCRPRGSACGEPGQACRRGAVVERPEPQPDYPAYGRMAAARVIAAGGLSDERTS